jgi:hypothetical protein
MAAGDTLVEQEHDDWRRAGREASMVAGDTLVEQEHDDWRRARRAGAQPAIPFGEQEAWRPASRWANRKQDGR